MGDGGGVGLCEWETKGIESAWALHPCVADCVWCGAGVKWSFLVEHVGES